METYAILYENEEPCKYTLKNTLYKYEYDNKDRFYIWSGGEWRESCSTAFNFLTVSK